MFTTGQLVEIVERLGPVGEERIERKEGVYLGTCSNGWIRVKLEGVTWMIGGKSHEVIELVDACKVFSLVGEVS